MISRIVLFVLLVSYSSTFAQLVYKPLVLCNGYEDGNLVRNHVEAHYTHKTAEIVSGSIIVDRVLVFADNNEIGLYKTYIERDTIATFYGTIHKGRKHGTFISLPPGNIFYISTYKDGIEEGPFKGFFNIGILYNEGYYKKGQKVGDYTLYYANGKHSMIVRRSNTKGLAFVEYFYQNGQLESKGTLYNDKKVNEWIYYTYQGKFEKMEYYSNKGRLIKRL